MKNKDKHARRLSFNEPKNEVINELRSSIYFKPADENAYTGKKLDFHVFDDIAHFATSTDPDGLRFRKTKKSNYKQFTIFGYAWLCILNDECYGWFRLFGRGLKWRRLSTTEPLFSEINGFDKRIKVFGYSIGLLKK